MKFVTGKVFLYAIVGGLIGLIFGLWRIMDSKKSLLQYEMKRAGAATVLFFKDTHLPYITYDLMFPKGGADFSSKPGMASVTGDLMDQGAGGLSSEELQNKLNSYGTGLSLGLGRQSCSLSLSGLSQHGDSLWDLFKKIITEPHLDSKELEVLKKQYAVSRLEKFNSPSAIAMEVWRKGIFTNHPFGEPRGGTIPSIKKISLQDIKTFYKEQYRESAPVFTVVGKYNETLKKDILSFFKEHFNSEEPVSPSASVQIKKSGQTLLITREDLVQSELIAGYALPPYPSSTPKKALALKLANNIFGGPLLSSRLMSHLREKMGLAYGVNSSFSFNKIYGLFILDGATKTESTGQFLKEALNLLEEFRKKGITEEELSESKSSLKGRFLRQMETMEDRAGMFVYYHFQLGLKKTYLDNYMKQVDAISLDYTNEIIKEFVFPNRLQILIYGHPSVADQLDKLDIPSPQVIPFKEYFAEELP